MKLPIKYFIIPVAFILFSAQGCRKFLDVGNPVTETPSKTVFGNENSATAAMLSIYGEFMKNSASSIGASLYLGQSSDEFRSYGFPPLSNYYANNLTAIDNNDFWSTYFIIIYRCNAVLEGVEQSGSLAQGVKNQLKGEALFARAFFHFYLVNLFGDVPYISTTGYIENNAAPRMPVREVYKKIIADLIQARDLLGDGFPDAGNKPGTERVRPNKAAAQAMLARCYLYMGNWEDAQAQASAVIGNTVTYRLLSDLNEVFKKNSREAIWQMMPSDPVNTNGFEGYSFILTAPPGPIGQVSTALSDNLLNAFEPGDKRRSDWVGTFQTFRYPFKYKVKALSQPSTEYSMVIRLAELYLIRAEAWAQLNRLSEAVSDLDMIRDRAGLALLSRIHPGITQADLLDAVYRERQLELFGEWGHRWLDLKRTGRADAVLKPIKGNNWQSTDQLFPIPKAQIDYSPAYNGQQNPGYN